MREEDPAAWADFLTHVSYCQTHLDELAQYEALLFALKNQPMMIVIASSIWRLSQISLPTVTGLKEVGLLDENDGYSSRVVVEKPFGQ